MKIQNYFQFKQMKHLRNSEHNYYYILFTRFSFFTIKLDFTKVINDYSLS